MERVFEPFQQLIDSYRNLITPDSPDSTKAKYYFLIAGHSAYPDTIIKYANLSLNLCEDNDYRLLSKNTSIIGRAYLLADENSTALPFYQKALDYAKKAKNIMSKTNTALAKQKTRRMYNSSRLAQAEEELSKIGDETDPDTIARRYKLERDVTKYNAEINQLDKEIEFETQKQDNEVEKIYNNTLSSVDKGNDKDDTGEIEQAKMIERQVHKIEVDVRKLKKMKPSKELNEIQELIDQYKKLI